MNSKSWEYAESITELCRQAATLERCVKDGIRRWGGGQTKAVLAATLEAVISDTVAAASIEGDNEWLDSKRRWARRKLNDYGFYVKEDS